MSSKKPKKKAKRSRIGDNLEIRVKFNRDLMSKVDILLRKLSFGSRPELVRQSVREFILKHEDLLKE